MHPLRDGRLIYYFDDSTVLFAQLVAVELDFDGVKLYVSIALRLFEIILIIGKFTWPQCCILVIDLSFLEDVLGDEGLVQFLGFHSVIDL